MPKRYNIQTLLDKDDTHLIVPPPIKIADYEHKSEVINFILDKAFVPQAMTNEQIKVMMDLFKEHKYREMFIEMVYKDYEQYQLNHLMPEQIHTKNLKVNLP